VAELIVSPDGEVATPPAVRAVGEELTPIIGTGAFRSPVSAQPAKTTTAKNGFRLRLAKNLVICLHLDRPFQRKYLKHGSAVTTGHHFFNRIDPQNPFA